MPTNDGKIRILAIDGGGGRGLLALQVLAALEAITGRPAAWSFDYITGTSTGGLIALAIAKTNPYNARAITGIYEHFLPEIFKRSAWQKVKTLGQLAGPKYDNKALVDCAAKILGRTETLGTTSKVRHVMVPSYNISTRKPTFLSNYATPSVSLMDAALATSAAPTYFPPWRLDGSYYVDGGTCDNNPALSGVVEACRLHNCSVRDCLVLSLGTGSEMRKIDGAAAQGWGALSWVDPLVSIFTDGVSEVHGYHLNRLLPDANVLRVQCDVTGPLAEMDNVSAQNMVDLVNAGNAMVTTYKAQLAKFIERLEA